jgi:hypothetical protein
MPSSAPNCEQFLALLPECNISSRLSSTQSPSLACALSKFWAWKACHPSELSAKHHEQRSIILMIPVDPPTHFTKNQLHLFIHDNRALMMDPDQPPQKNLLA